MRLNTRALLNWTRMPYKIKENLMLASTRVHPLMSIAKERTVNGFATWKELPYIEVGQEKTFEDVLPIYTYRDYKPKPFIYYVRETERGMMAADSELTKQLSSHTLLKNSIKFK